MKKIIVYALVLVAIITAACKKENDTNPTNNNEVNATVIISPTSTININARGSKAKIGCSNSLSGASNFIGGTNENNAAVYVHILNWPTLSCITSPGTYNFYCSYRKNVEDQLAPIFGSNGTNGSITFTVLNDHYWEGYFNAVAKCIAGDCVRGVDSVIITGTFKGNF